MDYQNDHDRRSQASLASGLNLIAGLWLILAPFALNYFSIAARWNDIVVGLLILCLAGYRMTHPDRAEGLSWFNVGMGAWLLIAPFVLGYLTEAARWNDILVGLVIIGLGIWSAVSTPRHHHHPR